MYLTRAENAKREAMLKAQPLLDEYNQNLQNIAAGERQWGPDKWWPFSTPYTNQNARIQEQLRQIGIDTTGNVIAGSKLAEEMGLETGANPPPVSDQSTGVWMPQEAAPGFAQPPGQPMLRPMPRRMPPDASRFYMGPNVPLSRDRYQQFRRPTSNPPGAAAPPAQPPPAYFPPVPPPPAISPTDLVRTNQALGVPAPQQGTRFGVYLGPGEVLKKYRGKLVVYDTKLKKVVRSAE
jgi:hypothetical protein